MAIVCRLLHSHVDSRSNESAYSIVNFFSFEILLLQPCSAGGAARVAHAAPCQSLYTPKICPTKYSVLCCITYERGAHERGAPTQP